MKKIRIITGVLCLITLIGWGAYLYKDYKSQDNDPPVLQAGSKTLTVGINASESMLTKDVTAIDNVDGDISDRILIENIVKKENGKQNEFQITYVAFDQASNAGQLTRNLIYKDYKLPHFSLKRPLRFPENQEMSLLDLFKAEDCLEGDISSFITIEDHSGLSKQAPKAGFYEVTLSVTNSFGDTASLPVLIEIFQNTYDEQVNRPRMVLKDYIVYIEKDAEFEPKAYVDYVVDKNQVVIDNTKNTPTGNSQKLNMPSIKTESDVDTKVPGVYSVFFTYTSPRTGYQGDARLIVIVE